MIQLMDDRYHVAQACALLRDNPDRKIISAIHCWLGESPDHSRWAGLLFSVLTAWILLSTLRPRGSQPKADWPLALTIGLHPMVCFSFIYPSQLSTTVTCLWAALWLRLWNHAAQYSGPSRHVRIALAFGWSALAAGLRMEAWIYAWVLWVFQRLFKQEFDRSETPNEATGRRKWVWLILASAPALIRPEWTEFLLKVFSDDFIRTPPSTTSGSPVLTHSGQPILKLWFEWISAQSYVSWIYLRNVILPFFHTFHGPWSRAWQITHSWERLFWPALLFASQVTAVTTGVFGFQRGTIGRRILLSLPVFVLPTLLLSSVPRTDWYYPSRQILGTLVWLIWIANVLLESPSRIKAKWATAALAAMSVSALAYGVFFQYSSRENFTAHELVINGNHAHPWVEIEHGNRMLAAGDIRGSLRYFFNAYNRIDFEQAKKEPTVGRIWSISLYYLWHGLDRLGDSAEAKDVLDTLLPSMHYPATLACLQDQRVPLATCQRKERKDDFCTYLTDRLLPRLPEIRERRAFPCD